MNIPIKKNKFLYSIQNRPFLIYSLSFICLSALVFSAFWLFDKSLVLDFSDPKRQHYPALVYFGQWGRRIIKNIFSGNFSIPLWDFSIGYGADIITTFNYYCLGDPLNLFAILTPTVYTGYLYTFLILLRMYISGIGFYLLCKHFKVDNKIALFTALLYAFNFFNLRAGTMHIFFLNAPMYLPFLILGIEKIFCKAKPFVFIISVFLFTISNFYFAYVLILIAVVYVIIRFFCADGKKTFSSFFITVSKFFSFGLIGILLSAFILVPLILVYFNNTRSSAGVNLPLFYDFNYYEQFFADLLGNGINHWRVNGIHPLGLLSVFYIYTKKKQFKTQKVLFSTFTLFLLFPVFGYVFNAFIYPSNRFCFAYHFLLLFITALNLKSIINSKIEEKTRLFIIYGIYLFISVILFKISQTSTYIQLILLSLILFVLTLGDKIFTKNVFIRTEKTIIALGIVSTIITSHFYFSPTQSNRLYDYFDNNKINESYNNTLTGAFKNTLRKNKDFYRLQTENQDCYNMSVMTHTNGTNYYFSYCADNIPVFLTEIEALNYAPYVYYGVDNSAFLSALASVNYYSAPKNAIPPYNYKPIKAKKNYKLYYNDKSLPLGYTYDYYMTVDEYNKLSSVEKREGIIQNVLLEDKIDSFNSNNYSITSQTVPFEIKYPKSISVTDTGFYVKSANSKITLDFAGKENCETYVRIKNFNGQHLNSFELKKALPKEYNNRIPQTALDKAMANYKQLRSSSIKNFYIDFRSKIRSKEIILCNPEYKFYNGIHDFTVNMGYSEKAQNSITINFPTTGFFSWDSIEIYCQSMDNYESYIDNLTQNTLENIKIYDNSVEGTIELDTKKILCLSIPYSDGWTAYVDGKETEILTANTWSMALILKEGKHDIVLKYTTPGLKIGIAISFVGLCALISLFLIYKKQVTFNITKYFTSVKKKT